MAEDSGEIAVTVRVQKQTWNQFAYFCRANKVKIYQGVQAALNDVLDRHGLSPYAPDERPSRVEVEE